MRPVPQAALVFVRAHEGCKLTAYADSVGIWTVGYGHTGPSIHDGVTINQATADSYLRSDLEIAGERLAKRVTEDVILALTDNQYAALLSFVFNLGCGDWQIWKLLNQRKFDQIPAQISRFCNAGGQKLQGLVNRRAAEVVLWSTEEPGSVPDAPSSSATRAMDTPPTPEPTKPLAKQTSFVTKAMAGASLVGGAAAQYVPTVKGWADQLKDFTDSPIIGHIAMGLTTLAGGLLVVSLVSSFLKQKAASS
jgi:lysozyme